MIRSCPCSNLELYGIWPQVIDEQWFNCIAKGFRPYWRWRLAERGSCAGTIALPIGHSARPASFRCAQANGMPMMVDWRGVLHVTGPREECYT